MEIGWSPRHDITAHAGHELELYARATYARAEAPMRERLDEPEIAAAFASGKAMTEDDAVAYALANVGERPPLVLFVFRGRLTALRKTPRRSRRAPKGSASCRVGSRTDCGTAWRPVGHEWRRPI